MAGAVSSGGGRSRRGRRRRAIMGEINVTPFVDVMLVLLIVFMVTAPMLTAGIAVELPKTAAKQLAAEKEPLTVTVLADGTVFLQETQVSMEELLPRLEALASAGYEQRIFVRGDAKADYGRVAQVMAAMSAAGYRNLGLVTDPMQTVPVQTRRDGG
jgi:biopolymer transport protein TolR